MKLKTQIAVATLAVAASTLLVWSDPGENHTPTIEGVWQVTRVGVNCNDPNQALGSPFPAIMTFHRDGTVTGAAKSPVTGPFDTPEYGSWQREPGSQNYSFRELQYRYDGNGAFWAHLSSPPMWNSPAPTASSIAPRSSSSTLMGIQSTPVAAGRPERGLNRQR